MAQVDGMEVLRRVRERAPATEVLVITAYGTVETAVEAMKLGATDFISKPFSSEEFGVKVERILKERDERERLRKENVALRVENAWLKEDVQVRYGEIVGESPPMRDVFRWIERVARSESTAMIYGESGTGKELVARAIHAASGRREGPFIRVNCGALAEGAAVRVELVRYRSIQYDPRDDAGTLAAKAELLRSKAEQADTVIAQIDRDIGRIERQLRRTRNVESLVTGVEHFGDIQAPGAPTRAPAPGDVRALPDSTGVARPERTPEQRLQELRLLRGQVEAAKREFLQRAQTFERMVRTIG